MLKDFNLSSRALPARLLCGLSLALFIALLGGVSGCGNKGGAKVTVTGKVTLNGSPVAGQVTFHGPDGKDSLAVPTNSDGTYSMPDPPTGQCKVTVKPMIGSSGLVKPPEVKDQKMPDMPGSAAAGVAPPPKYHNAQSTDLTYDVKATPATQTYDIQLQLK